MTVFSFPFVSSHSHSKESQFDGKVATLRLKEPSLLRGRVGRCNQDNDFNSILILPSYCSCYTVASKYVDSVVMSSVL